MLYNAHLVWDDVTSKFREVCNTPKYKYFSPLVNWAPSLDINKLQYASCSVGYGKGVGIDGYIECRVDGTIIRDVVVCSFNDNGASVIRDMVKLLRSLFDDFDYRKICFSTIYNNPLYNTAARLGKAYGARYVGTAEDDRRIGGKYYDLVMWEIHRKDYKRIMASRKLSRYISNNTEVDNG